MDHDFATPPLQVEPVTLTGRHVRLEPLAESHLDELWPVASEASLWQWIPWPVRSKDDLHAYIVAALDGQAAGTMLPFLNRLVATDEAIGSSRFGNIAPADYRAEIGWTWVGVPWQRSAANSEAKLLMLDHAFGTWHCHRVEFKTDSLNEKSRNGLLGIGATFEGIFRNHVVTHTGRMRHSAYYAITDDDWPMVRARLVERLAAGGRAPAS
jgi:RimJ/RimL family protein N-acetyltransferase